MEKLKSRNTETWRKGRLAKEKYGSTETKNNGEPAVEKNLARHKSTNSGTWHKGGLTVEQSRNTGA
jgi:hypothetical protein